MADEMSGLTYRGKPLTVREATVMFADQDALIHSQLTELDQLRQRVAEADAKLAECFRLGGADNDGNGESWQAQRAVESVRNLRKDYDDACEEMYGEGGLNKRAEQAEAKLALAGQDARRWQWFRENGDSWYGPDAPAFCYFEIGIAPEQLDAAIDAAIASQENGNG